MSGCFWPFFSFHRGNQQLKCMPGHPFCWKCKIQNIFFWISRHIKRRLHHCPAVVLFLLVCLFAVKFFQPELDIIDPEDIEKESCCLFYPTNVFKCSWSLVHLQASRIIPHIRYFLMTLRLGGTASVRISQLGVTCLFFFSLLNQHLWPWDTGSVSESCHQWERGVGVLCPAERWCFVWSPSV